MQPILRGRNSEPHPERATRWQATECRALVRGIKILARLSGVFLTVSVVRIGPATNTCIYKFLVIFGEVHVKAGAAT